MITQHPGRRNHFSYKTGVSLALPRDWEEVEEPDFAVVYACVGLPEPSPKIGISVYPVDEAQADAYRQVAGMIVEGDTSKAAYHRIAQQESLVDGYPALTEISGWTDETYSQPVVRHLTVIQASSYIFTIIAVLGQSVADDYLKVLDEVIRSIRFISTAD